LSLFGPTICSAERPKHTWRSEQAATRHQSALGLSKVCIICGLALLSGKKIETIVPLPFVGSITQRWLRQENHGAGCPRPGSVTWKQGDPRRVWAAICKVWHSRGLMVAEWIMCGSSSPKSSLPLSPEQTASNLYTQQALVRKRM